jgi:hypothetical protein
LTRENRINGVIKVVPQGWRDISEAIGKTSGSQFTADKATDISERFRVSIPAPGNTLHEAAFDVRGMMDKLNASLGGRLLCALRAKRQGAGEATLGIEVLNFHLVEPINYEAPSTPLVSNKNATMPIEDSLLCARYLTSLA